jgi:hypothetical protein
MARGNMVLQPSRMVRGVQSAVGSKTSWLRTTQPQIGVESVAKVDDGTLGSRAPSQSSEKLSMRNASADLILLGIAHVYESNLLGTTIHHFIYNMMISRP